LASTTHGLLPTLLHCVRLKAVRQQAVVGRIVDSWHFAAPSKACGSAAQNAGAKGLKARLKPASIVARRVLRRSCAWH
jgi:hypothetical protein